MYEYGFELALCARLEAETDAVVSRQLGAGVVDPGGRVIDTLLVEPGPEFDERVAITPERIPDAAIESDVGPGRARYWRDAFDCHPDRARSAVERAIDVGFFERERRSGRTYVRQTVRYPNWYRRLIGIENKPDLERPGDLESQLRTDVSLGVLDEIILATASHVTRAHLHRLPDPVGVWRIDPETGQREVIREPTPLNSGGFGVELGEQHPGRTEIAVVEPAQKARRRRRMAERAYEKGWRTFEFPDCDECTAGTVADASVPYCTWKERIIDPANCGPDCPGYDPAEPLDVDLAAERAERSPWDPDPTGRTRRQTGLYRFGR